MRQILLLFILHFSLAGSLFAQDTLGGTISVKKNKKVLKKLDVYNYPKLDSKESEGLLTETSTYDVNGTILLRSNFYNNTNETYSYNSKGQLTSMRVYNAYLKSYMYQDSLTYNERDQLIQKVRFRSNKLNAGGRELGAKPSKGVDHISDSVLFLETYTYDTIGKLKYKANQKGKIFSCFTFEYDSIGNQIRERAVSTSGKDSLIVINTTTYNATGEPVKYVEKNVRDEIFKTSINKFDSKGNKVETLTYDGSFSLMEKFEFLYDKESNMIRQNYFHYNYSKGNKEPVLSSESKIKYGRSWW